VVGRVRQGGERWRGGQQGATEGVVMKYKVVKYSFKGRRRVIRRHLSLADAQAICSRPDSSSKSIPNYKGNPWFHGYEEER
jgi:hypothetical protein